MEQKEFDKILEIEKEKSWDSGWRWGLLVGSLLTGVPMFICLYYLTH